jgi:hypothetical protein
MFKILIPLALISINCFAYNRDVDYGKLIDTDRDCQDTRAELLIKETKSPIIFTNEYNCIVKSGKWEDFYTGKIYTNAKDIQIDHLISTHQHYDSIGKTLTKEQRVRYANDFNNLVIANSTLNKSKGDKDLSEFIQRVPRENRCKYIKKYNEIATRNNIAIDKSDQDIINQNKSCML